MVLVLENFGVLIISTQISLSLGLILTHYQLLSCQRWDERKKKFTALWSAYGWAYGCGKLWSVHWRQMFWKQQKQVYKKKCSFIFFCKVARKKVMFKALLFFVGKSQRMLFFIFFATLNLLIRISLYIF